MHNIRTQLCNQIPVTQLDIWLHNRLPGCITYEAQLPAWLYWRLPSCTTDSLKATGFLEYFCFDVCILNKDSSGVETFYRVTNLCDLSGGLYNQVTKLTLCMRWPYIYGHIKLPFLTAIGACRPGLFRTMRTHITRTGREDTLSPAYSIYVCTDVRIAYSVVTKYAFHNCASNVA